MSQGQRRVLDAIIIFAVLLIVLSGWFQQFWQALFSKNQAPLNLNPFSGVKVTGPSISVPGLTVTPGTITIPGDTQTSGNPAPNTVPAGTNTQPVAPTPPLVTGTVSEQENVANAVAKTGYQNWDGLCETFVEQMTGLSPIAGSASAAFLSFINRGVAVVGNAQSAPAGSFVYLANGGAGHVGISLGGGNIVSALEDPYGVTSESIATFLAQNPGYSVSGYVPPAVLGPGATTVTSGPAPNIVQPGNPAGQVAT